MVNNRNLKNFRNGESCFLRNGMIHGFMEDLGLLVIGSTGRDLGFCLIDNGIECIRTIDSGTDELHILNYRKRKNCKPIQ